MGLASTADDQPLRQGHPNHPKAMRVATVLTAIPLLIGALVAEYLTAFPNFIIAAPVALILLLVVVFLPQRRYAVRGHAMSGDRLRVVKGIMFHSDTVVPFGRVQHIDVDRGPIERYYGLATLQLYTDRLIADGLIPEGEIEDMKAAFQARLNEEFEAGKDYKPNKADWLDGRWSHLDREKDDYQRGETAIAKETFDEIGKALTTAPEGFATHKTVDRLLDSKRKMFETGEGFD